MPTTALDLSTCRLYTVGYARVPDCPSDYHGAADDYSRVVNIALPDDRYNLVLPANLVVRVHRREPRAISAVQPMCDEINARMRQLRQPAKPPMLNPMLDVARDFERYVESQPDECRPVSVRWWLLVCLAGLLCWLGGALAVWGLAEWLLAGG